MSLKLFTASAANKMLSDGRRKSRYSLPTDRLLLANADFYL